MIKREDINLVATTDVIGRNNNKRESSGNVIEIEKRYNNPQLPYSKSKTEMIVVSPKHIKSHNSSINRHSKNQVNVTKSLDSQTDIHNQMSQVNNQLRKRGSLVNFGQTGLNL